MQALTSYTVTPAGVEATKPEVQAAVQRLTKQQAAKARKKEADLGDAGSVVAIPVSAQRVQSTAFYEYLDSVVKGCFSNSTGYLLLRFCFWQLTCVYGYLAGVNVVSCCGKLSCWYVLPAHPSSAQFLSSAVRHLCNMLGHTSTLCGEVHSAFQVSCCTGLLLFP